MSDAIRAEQIKGVYRGTMPGLIASLVAAVVVAGLLIYLGNISVVVASIFVGSILLQSAARTILVSRYWRRDRPVGEWRRWAGWITASALVGGLCWGLGSVWLMAPGQIDEQILLLLVDTAIASGAVTAFGSYLPTYRWNVLPIMLPPMFWFAWLGDVPHLALALMIVIWLAAILALARRFNANVIASLQLRFENLDLVESLREQTALAERARELAEQQKELAEQANIAKSRFLASASHDLRQPVHALGMFIGALRGQAMSDDARRLVEHIDGSVGAMDGLFASLLDISRLDAGVVQAHPVNFALQPLLERICGDYIEEARLKGIRLKQRSCSETVESDPVLVGRILRNLIANAARYTDRGRILVGCRRRGTRVRVEVWDTGRGIPPTEQGNVYREFYQLGNPERDRSKGLGLGLAIVKRLAQLLDCPLSLRSEPGKGSVFALDLPRAAPTAPVVVPVTATGSSASAPRLILVIDDEIAIQEAMRSLLTGWGHKVIAAGSYAEMERQIAALPLRPDLLISDYRLRGEENGIAAIQRLQELYNEAIPAMLITGDTAPDRLKEAQASGFRLLHKPVANTVLSAAIDELTSAVAVAAK